MWQQNVKQNLNNVFIEQFNAYEIPINRYCVCVLVVYDFFFDPHYMEFDVCSIDLYIKNLLSTLSLALTRSRIHPKSSKAFYSKFFEYVYNENNTFQP